MNACWQLGFSYGTNSPIIINYSINIFDCQTNKGQQGFSRRLLKIGGFSWEMRGKTEKMALKSHLFVEFHFIIMLAYMRLDNC